MQHDDETQRWRGGVQQRLEEHERQLRQLWAYKEDHSEEVSVAKKEIYGRITVLETKQWAFTAVAALAGTLLGSFISHVIAKVLGG